MGIIDIIRGKKKEEVGDFDSPQEESDIGLPERRFNNTPDLQPNFLQNSAGDKDMELVLTKLDLINQKLDSIDKRLQAIEKIAKDSQ